MAFSNNQTLSDSRNLFGKAGGDKLVFCVDDEERHPCFVDFTRNFKNLVLQKKISNEINNMTTSVSSTQTKPNQTKLN